MTEILYHLMKSAIKDERALRLIAKSLKAQQRFNVTMLLGYTLLGFGYAELVREMNQVQRKLRELDDANTP